MFNRQTVCSLTRTFVLLEFEFIKFFSFHFSTFTTTTTTTAATTTTNLMLLYVSI